ncbi:S-methyl-5-thioribose-1-phosphate isomerase [Cumulibacter soli]|uniref:S-methyl-5-thioribose-1-phosphate isomerase n=1 Tax=Cumulibacter soli TaxID=2546344 RepID=UPI001FBA2C76|nr:S-methyl-5-thioribose-1-phosphate isomerase [Cumulibacter soli]
MPASGTGAQRLRPIDWVDGPEGYLRLLDQTRLPGEEHYLRIDNVDALIDAIRRLATRGAPALGVAGAFGVVLAAQRLPAGDVPAAIAKIRSARPTAVNLAVGTDLAARALADGGLDAALSAAKKLRDDDILACAAMARRGADEIYRAVASDIRADHRPTGTGPRPVKLMTICNTGALAAVERGTALGVLSEVLRDGRLAHAYACETRPLLQGARLTAWELQRMGAPYDLIVDSAAASTMRRGYVDAVLAGADRIAANGDTANKIGTFALALAARYAGIPFYIVAPETTVDLHTASGDDIDIEDRGSYEIVSLAGVAIAPEGTTALNPAFDVTPADLITAIITERRTIRTGIGQRPDA